MTDPGEGEPQAVPGAAAAARGHPQADSPVTVDLTAVIVTVDGDQPCVLVRRLPGVGGDSLPWGPLRPEHRTLQAGLRAWVEQQTQLGLGYVEQLYTFGDRNRALLLPDAPPAAWRAISVAYLALVRADTRRTVPEAAWSRWYDFLPWEDWRGGVPSARAAMLEPLTRWRDAAASPGERRERGERVCLAFGTEGAAWDEERALERYELLYSARLVPEAWIDAGEQPPDWLDGLPGWPMAADHRRILATAIGRLRGKIKYRPVLFELLPPSFTLLQLQRTAEAISGARLHKQNFRRRVSQERLVEETGAMETATGGRPAKLMRFRREVTLERPAPGVRVSATRRASPI